MSVPIPNIWYVSPAGSDSNHCLSSGAPCLTIAHAESLSAAGDTINLAAGTYRLSPGGRSTAGYISAKSNQTFVGPACTPTSVPCQAVISGGISIGGLALGPDASRKLVRNRANPARVRQYLCQLRYRLGRVYLSRRFVLQWCSVAARCRLIGARADRNAVVVRLHEPHHLFSSKPGGKHCRNQRSRDCLLSDWREQRHD